MLDKKLRHKLEWAFYNYSVNKLIAAERIAEIMEAGVTVSYEHVKVAGGKTHKPTESKAIKLIDANNAYLWCKVVENTMLRFKWHTEGQIIRLKYFAKLKWYRVGEKLGLGENTRYWRDRILLYAAQWALEYKLIADL